MHKLPRLTTNVYFWIVRGDYKGTWFRTISEGYFDKVLGDYVYKVEHSLGFTMFISESDLFNKKKYAIKDYLRRIDNVRKL